MTTMSLTVLPLFKKSICPVLANFLFLSTLRACSSTSLLRSVSTQWSSSFLRETLTLSLAPPISSVFHLPLLKLTFCSRVPFMTKSIKWPWVANLFMGHHEKIWLEKYKGPDVLFYRCFVHDNFFLFHSEQDAITCFNYISSQHPNTYFSMETEIDQVLPFLDVKATRLCSRPFQAAYVSSLGSVCPKPEAFENFWM